MMLSAVSPIVQTKANPYKRYNTTPKMPYTKADNVSFKAKDTIVDVQLRELFDIYNSDIQPLILNSKDLFTQIGLLGMCIQDFKDIYTQKENEYFKFKLKLSQQGSSLCQEKYPVLASYEEYKNNIKHYNYFYSLSKNDMYKDSRLQELLKKDSSLFDISSEFSSISNLYTKAEVIDKLFNKELNEKNLKNSNPVLFSKVDILLNKYNEIAAYMLFSPCTDAFRLEKELYSINNCLKKTKTKNLDLLRRIEKARATADRIISKKHLFYDNKEKIVEIADKSNSVISMIPKRKELCNAYDAMKNSCNTLFSSLYQPFNLNENNLPYDKHEEDALQKRISLQNNVLKSAQNLVYAVKKDFYESEIKKNFFDPKN